MIDIGANLTHESFSEDFDGVLQRAKDAGVTQIMVTGASLQSSKQALELADRYQNLFATAGIHPHYAEETTQETIEALKEFLKNDKVKAIGETGLDFFRDICPRAIQKRSFEQHLELAIESNLPMFLHEREAFPSFSEILSTYRDDLGKVVIHCFTGDKNALTTYLDLDCYIGITGWICDERRGKHLLTLVKDIPSDRLLIETDAPYLMPRNVRPKPKNRRNEPHYLSVVCKTIAQCRETNTEDLATQTSANARLFFSLPGPTKDKV